MAGMNVSSVLQAYQTQNQVSQSKATESKTEAAEANSVSKMNLGKTVGEPKLSETAQKYYNQLKKKFGQYDFILVSAQEKENARANAGSYANSLKTVVLIDEEKIEKMATDENFRKQYESILSGATNQINQIKAAAEKNGANLQGVVMQVNDNGTTSFFAALKKTNEAQQERLEKKAEEKKAAKKEAEKKAAKKEQEERLQEDSEIVTIMADSLESLIQKIEEYNFNERSNSVQTEGEKMVGQNIDFRG